jgi:hypothetical protein
MEKDENERVQVLQCALSRQGFARLVVHLVVHAAHRIDVVIQYVMLRSYNHLLCALRSVQCFRLSTVHSS